MEKETQPDSISAVTIKPDYPPSEAYSTEPPPAYRHPQSSAVQVAKIVAVTVVVCSVVLGSFLLASAYVTANASCRQLEQELELLGEAADRFQPPPQAEALVQDEPSKHQSDLLSDNVHKDIKETETNAIENDSDGSSEASDGSSDSSQSDEEEEDRTPIHFKLPLQLDFDDLAGALIEKNQKSRMNCIVEKKKAEEVVDHQPKTLRLPFGVNLTTDPRYERLSGERMVIVCESGNMQRAQPPPQPQPQEDEEDTIMIQPVMIPIPHTNFQTHMPQQMMPMQAQMQAQAQPMRPPMGHPMHPMQPMESMRPPMPPMMQPQPNQVHFQAQQAQQQNEMPPNPILHHIVQQIIAQKIVEAQKAREEMLQQEQQQPEGVVRAAAHRFQPVQEQGNGPRFPIPEEVLTQLNRLPNRDVIVAVSEPDSEEAPQEVRYVQEQRQNAVDVNGRQAFARGLPLPVHIPVSMMPNEQENAREREVQVKDSEEMTRPHYVHPRSVRSVDALLAKDQKRVKRCACDCAC